MAIIILSFMVNVFILLYGHHYIHIYVICFYSHIYYRVIGIEFYVLCFLLLINGHHYIEFYGFFLFLCGHHYTQFYVDIIPNSMLTLFFIIWLSRYWVLCFYAMSIQLQMYTSLGEVYSIQDYVIKCQWFAAGRWFSSWL